MIARTVFLCLFFASGAAALVYQVIWQRLLTFTIGTDSHAVTIIVAAFMVGLGLGSLAGGAIADRLERRARLWAFAGCELGIALFAIVSASLFYDVLYLRLGASALPRVVLGSLSFVALLWPTLLMGMSLPLAARILTDDVKRPDEWVPILYGWNTLGAAAGAWVAVTVLFGLADFRSSLLIAAVLNATFGIAAIVFALRTSSLTDPPGDRLASPQDDEPVARITSGDWTRVRTMLGWMAIYALSGFIALSLEIVWFRILGIVLKSTALTFGLLLGMYLTGLGVGSLAGHSKMARRLPAARSFLALQTAVPVYAALALALLVSALGVPFAEPLATYLGGYHGRPLAEFLRPSVLMVTVGVPALLMGPPTFFMGLSFGSLQRAVQTDLSGLGRRVGWLQAANILGAVLGTLLTGFVMLDRFGTSGTMRMLVCLGGVFLWLFLRSPHDDRSSRFSRIAKRLSAVGTLAVAALAIPQGTALWPRLHGIQQGGAVYAEDSTGLALLKPEPGNGTTLLFANGLGHSRLPYGGMHTVLGALPALMHPNPAHIAVIGLGSGDTTYAVAGREETLSVESIEIVGAELTSLRLWSATEHMPGLRELLQDPRVHFHLMDGRAFLLRSAARFDVIEADALWPRTAYSGNLYSVEYFRLLRARLNPSGYAVTWIPTPRTRDSLVAEFPYVLIAGEIGIASETPIEFNAQQILNRLERPFTKAYYLAADLDLRHELAAYLAKPPEIYGPGFDRRRLVDLNYDLSPKDEFRRR